MAQENLIKRSSIPWTIVHSTQFFEFLSGIAQAATNGQSVRLSPAYVQPIAADDVAQALADVALGSPASAIVEIAGPEKTRLAELVRRFLRAKHDPRTVVDDVHARYFSAELDDQSLVPMAGVRLSSTRFEDWLCRSPALP